jgi:hypothetical protein
LDFYFLFAYLKEFFRVTNLLFYNISCLFVFLLQIIFNKSPRFIFSGYQAHTWSFWTVFPQKKPTHHIGAHMSVLQNGKWARMP